MALIVQKFGGTSVATPERIQAAARRVARARAGGDQIVVVISAMGEQTDELLTLAGRVAPGAALRRRRELDLLLASGEQVSASLLALALEEHGIPALALTGPQAEILTDDVHGTARIRAIRARRARRALAQGRTPVVAGFQGISRVGDVTTLGRGGSDTTAVAIAVALGADRCDIYTDVAGIYSADPRLVPAAKRYDRLTHREALLLTRAGASILHPRAAALAALHGLPVRVLSSFAEDDDDATTIEGETGMEGLRVLGVTSATGAVRLVIEEPSASVAITAAALHALAAAGISIEALEEQRADGFRRLSLVVSADDVEAARGAIQGALGAGARIRTEEPAARITIVGTGLFTFGLGLAAALRELTGAGIDAEDLELTDEGITFFVAPERAGEAVRLLHAALLEGERRSRHPAATAGRDDDPTAILVS